MKRLILLSLLSLTYFFSFGGGPLTGSLVYFPGSGTLKPLGIHLYFNGFRLDSIYGSSQIPSDWNALSGPTRILNKPSFLSPEDTCSDQDNGHGPIIHCAFPGLIMTKYKADALYLPIGFTESDPLFASSPAYDITTNEISTWNNLNSFTGFGTDHSHAAYGDHSHRWLIDSISGFAGMVGKIKVDMPKYRLAFTLSTIPHGGPPPPYYFHDSLLFTEEHPTGYPNKIRLIAKGAIGTTAEIGSPQNPFDTLYTNHIYPPINTTDTSLDAVQHTLSGNNILRYGGNVGIGTTSPSYKLEVEGTASTDEIRSWMGLDFYTVPNPVAPTLASMTSGGAVDDGIHQYMLTYTTAIGATNVGGVLSVTVSGSNQTVNLNIPVSTDPRVTGRKIYRTKAGDPSYAMWYLGTVSDNTTTTYTDIIADSSLPPPVEIVTTQTNTTQMILQ